MTTQRTIVPLPIKGGWAPALGPSSSEITHLINAENVYFELDGGVRKIPGATRLNSVQLTESGSPVTIMAMFDFWKSGTGGTSTQKRMCYAGTKLYKEDLDGTWDVLTTGLEANKPACFTQYNDLAIWASTSTTDVPQKWNQTDATTSALGGSPPNFAFCIPHRGRLWAAGVATNPSRLYYSALDNPEDWTGAGSGSIDIGLNDGDQITGIASHKQRLWIFKGPNRGSIHYLTGSSPTGADAFAITPLVTGVPCVAHQTIVSYPDDLAWLSTRGLHSLKATDQYGDMADSFLSFPLTHGNPTFFPDGLTLSALPFAQGVHHAGRGVLLWTLRQSGMNQNNYVLAYDYRFQPGRFSLLTAYGAASLAICLVNGQPRLHSGGYDGYTLIHDQVNRNLAGNAYTARVTVPFLDYGKPDLMKTTAKLRAGLQPRGVDPITVNWQNDEEVVVSDTISQTGGTLLDDGSGTGFLLDDGTGTGTLLGGGGYVQRYLDLPGSYRVQQLEFVQNTLNGDMELHSLGVQLETDSLSEV